MAFPTTTGPSLLPWQMSYGGLAIGLGTAYGFYKADGLDRPQVRSGDTARPRDWGELKGLDLYSGRDVTLTMDIVPVGSGTLLQATQALDSAFAIGGATELPLWIQGASTSPIVASMCRFRKGSRTLDQPYGLGEIARSIYAFHATDPRIYGAKQSQTIGLNAPGGGLTFPITFPLTFGTSSGATNIIANNAGNVEMRPVLTITGPCTNPVVGNATTGWLLGFSNPAQTGHTLNTGDLLVIDTDLCSIMYYPNGSSVGSPRRNWLEAGSVWPNQGSYPNPILGLAPGNNTINFESADASAVAGTLTVAYASAWSAAI